MKQIRSLLLVVLVAVAGCASNKPAARPGVEVDLLTLGDWGRGGEAQEAVAEAMSRYVTFSGRRFTGLLSVGDNFYPYLASTKDPKWKTLFEEMYDPRVLNFPFYMTLGNHDYDNGKKELAHISKAEVEFAYARENPTSRWKLPGNWYRLDFPAEGTPLVSVVMLNSNRRQLSDQQWDEQRAFMKRELSERKGATWLVVVAHHPLYSNGSHGDGVDLQKEWGPLLKKHRVDFYLAGHDHDVQHLEVAGHKTSFVLVGGGGATTRPMRRDDRGPWSQATYGFGHLQFTPERATVTYLSGADGEVLHRFVRKPGGEMKVLKQGESSPARKR